MNCQKFKFDYRKHIILKRLIGIEYRNFVTFSKLFQGVTIERCENCFVEGYSSLGVPFLLEDISEEETKCTLERMGLKELDVNEIEIMPELLQDEKRGLVLCEHCILEKEGEYG